MDLYVVMINDRHTEPTAYVYSTPELAIAAAREYAEAAVHGSCTVDEQVPPDGWLYHAVYCVEGDDVWVVPATLDGEVGHLTDTLADLLAAADELTDPRRHVESITGWVNRNRKTIRRTVTLPSLLEQLAAAVVPGETHVEGDTTPSGFASRPPARLDAIDRLLAIEASAARWVASMGLVVREDTCGNIRALVGISGTLDSDTLAALITEVTMWRAWAATVTGWSTPPFRPHVPCPVCDKVGSLRIRLDRKTACCMECGDVWEEADGSIFLLGEHVKAETERKGAA